MPELISTQLHWLRPWWLLVLLLTPLVYGLLKHRSSGDSGWSVLIPQHLLSPLLPPPDQQAFGARKTPAFSSPLLATLALIMLTLALAGPVWRQAPSPASAPADSLVVVLDLSLSMLATDVQPNRLTLAKRKIRDILATRKGSLTGLVVYAADAHSVTPLSDDSATVESMLSVLDPLIMPAAGNRADLGVRQALDLLARGAPGNGRILLISDGVAPQYRQTIVTLLADGQYPLDTLTIGTRAGGPIPLPERGFIRDGERIVISQAAPDEMARLAAENRGNSATLTLNDSDLKALNVTGSARVKPGRATTDPTNTRYITQWQEDAYWLLWLALPLLLLVWRRGGLALLALAFLPALPQQAQAFSWNELWQREDQRAPALIDHDPQQAAEKLRSPQWQGTALYRSGDFEAAGKRFAESPGADADYNRGNALARASKLEQALAAYDKALAGQPGHPDALANRALVEQLLQEQQKQPQDSQQDSSSEQNPSDDQKNGQGSDSQNNEQRADSSQQPSEDPQQPSDDPQQVDENADGTQSPSAPEPSGDERADARKTDVDGDERNDGEKNGDEPGQGQVAADTEEAPLNQSQQQYLRRIPDDPGGLLQQKFLQQYQQRRTPADKGDTPW